MPVEPVTVRLTWPKVLGSEVLTGAWLGLFIGLILGFFSPSPNEEALDLHSQIISFHVRSDHLGDPVRDGTRHEGFRSTMQLVAGRMTCCATRRAPKRAGICWRA